MADWTAMQTMCDAHKIGLEKLAKFEAAVKTLKTGNSAVALEVLEDTVKFFEEDLRMHFRHEEQALFPVLGKLIGRAGPIDAMLQEHDSLWRAIDSFGELVVELSSAGQGDTFIVAQLEKVASHIVWLLTSHIQKEDTMLFPLAEKTLDPSGKREVDDSVEVLERMYGAPE